MASGQYRCEPTKVLVTLADSSTVTLRKKVSIPIKPYQSREKPALASFYIHENATAILGQDALLGIDLLKMFNLSISTSSGNLEIFNGGLRIGEETLDPKATQALMITKSRTDYTRADEGSRSIIHDFKDAFGDIGPEPIRGKPMRIITTHQKPIFAKQRNYSPPEIAEMKIHIHKLLKQGIIEPTISGYSATSRIIPKKSGASRLVVNYIPLNKCTVRDSYSLPQIADIFGVVQGNKFFTTMDCSQGFYQILIDDRDRHKTAFSTPVGNFQFVRCPFGARNSPAVFQAEMNRIFADGLYTKCIVYIDDILVFGRTKTEHDYNLRWVLSKCLEYNVKIKPDKCAFAKQEVEYLGFTINGHSIRPLTKSIESLRLSQAPRDKTELRSIIGKLNFYSRFIPQYSKQLEPIRELLRNNKDFQWKHYHQEVLRKILEPLDKAEPHMLASRSDPKIIEIYILTDSIEVLLLSQDEKLISRTSRFLLTAESNYSLIEKQLLALVFGVNKFKIWIEPGKLKVRLPSNDLEKTLKLVHKPSRVDKWLLRLPEGYDEFLFEVNNNTLTKVSKQMPAHIPEEVYYVDGACKANGKPNCEATWAVCAEFDRDLEESGYVLESASNNSAELTAAIEACKIAKKRCQKAITIVTDSRYLHSAATNWIDKWCKNEWVDHRKRPVVNEKLFRQLLNVKEGLNIEWIHVKGHSDTPGNIRADSLARALLDKGSTALCGSFATGYRIQQDCEEMKSLKKQINKGNKPNFIIEDDLIYFLDPKLSGEDSKRIFVPSTSRKCLLNLAHDDPILGGHLGIKKTFRKLIRFWWPGMNRDVEEYIKSCDTCQSFKSPSGLPPGYLQSIPVSKVFEHVHVDMVGPLKSTTRGNSYIITATDAFSKWAFAKPCQTIRTSDVTGFIEESIISIHGKPQLIISDRGAQFTSNEWKTWLKKMDIPHNLTTPRHPQSNGIDERLNGTLARILRTYVDKEQANWDEQLKWALYVYNTTVHESTGFSPYQILHGLDPRNPLKNNESGEDLLPDKLERTRTEIREHASNNNKEAQGNQKNEYDRRHSKSNLRIGDEVLVRELFISTHWSKKFYPKWYGPCTVIHLIGDKNNPKAVTVFDYSNWSKKTVSIGDVKPYVTRDHDKYPNPQKEGEAVTLVDVNEPSESSYYTYVEEQPNLITFSDTTAQSPRNNEPTDTRTSIGIIENNHNLSPRQPKSSSPRRVTINDNIETFTYNSDTTTNSDNSSIDENMNDATVIEASAPSLDDNNDESELMHSARESFSQQDTPSPKQNYKSPYVVDFIIDNSTTDPTYKPPNVVSNITNEPQSTNLEETPGQIPDENTTITTVSPHISTPEPRYNLRSYARRRNTTFDNEIASENTKSGDSSNSSSDSIDNLSVNSGTNPALTSDSETDQEDTLIQD